MKKVNILKYLSRLMCLVMIVSLVACGDDDDDDDNNDDNNDDMMAPDDMVDELVNTYEFTSATFNAETVIAINNPADVTQLIASTFAVDADGTAFLIDAIEGAAPCSDDVNVGIDLREDGLSVYVCEGETAEENQGAWVVNDDRTTFTLSITSLGVDVILNPWTLSNGVLNGTATIPLPYDATVGATGEQNIATGDPLTQSSVDLLNSSDLSLTAGTPNLQTVSMEVTFTVVDF